MQVRIEVASAIVMWGLVAIAQPAQAQNVLRQNSRTNSQAGTISADLLEVYKQTKVEQTEQKITAIARKCAAIVPDPARSKADREYAGNLFAWALNRRGEMRSDKAADLVSEGKLNAAEKLDEQAAEDFRTAIKYGPPNWRFRHNYAISLAMKGLYERAIDEFNQAIDLQPEYANAYFNRAELYFELGEYATAAEDYSQAIAISSEDPQYYNSRGHCRFMLEDFDQAIEDYRQAAELGSDSGVYLTDLADAYQHQGKWKLAAKAYQQAVAANKQYGRAYQNAAWLMSTCPNPEIRQRELAVNSAKRAVELEGDIPRALDTLAAATANAGDFQLASKLTRQAIEISQDTDEIQELKQRLNLYAKRQAYRQPDSGGSPMEKSQNLDQYRIRTASGNTVSGR